MEDNNKDAEEQPDKLEQFFDWVAAKIKSWHKMASLSADDSFLVGAFKIGIRIIGILILLALSPFALLGLLIGISAAL